MTMVSPASLAVDVRYKPLTGSVVPRFIAWIASESPSGVGNLAPFSYATIASHSPMSLLFVVAGPKPDGSPEDTLPGRPAEVQR